MSEDTFYVRLRVWLGEAAAQARSAERQGRRGPGTAVETSGQAAEGELWHGPRWAPDDRASETVRRFVESPALNRLEQARRAAGTILHLVRALRGLQALDADQAARPARRGATRWDDCDDVSEADAEAMRREIAERIRRMKAAAG